MAPRYTACSMPPNLIRAFIAIELPPTIRQQLEKVVRQFQAQRLTGVRWVAVNNIHLTLKFLGDSSPHSLEKLTARIEPAARSVSPFPIQVTGLGAFPNPRRPRVIWVGLQAPPALAELQKAIEAQAAAVGFSLDARGFSPHLTLGRVQQSARGEEVARISSALAQTQVGLLGEFNAKCVSLFRSDLRPGGAVYTHLAEFPLKSA